ncbi:MAG: class I SAM-dependent methyltransferase [Brevundimonas sp.]|jgi:predicted methyltransferase
MRLLALVLSTTLVLPAIAEARSGPAMPGPVGNHAARGPLVLAPPVPQEDEVLRAVIDRPSRPAEDSARDVFRHPFETLTFWGLTPGQTVIEIEPGAAGWWRNILEPYARDSGGRYVAVNRPTDGMGVADGTADLVVVARAFHNWARDGRTDPYLAAAFRALKPGGVLAVEQHRSPEGTDVTATAPTGYVPESYVIDAARRAGFVLDARSELNANARDDHHHPFGVWTLPPVRRSSGPGRTLTPAERAGFDAVGESDRMTLRFRKPG